MSANLYYDPEKFGLRSVAEVEFSTGAYEFDTSVIWQDVETGALYYADDAGCSCPLPFEGHDRATIKRVEKMQDLIDYFEARKSESYNYNPDPDWGSPWDVERIDAAVGEAILAATKARDVR